MPKTKGGGAPFEAMRSFVVTVNYGLDWLQMIKASDFDEVQKKTPKKKKRTMPGPLPFPIFPISQNHTGIVTKHMALIRTNADINIFDLDNECRKAGWMLSSAEDGLAFSRMYRLEQLKTDIIVAGTAWFNGVSEYANYVFLTSRNGKRRLATTIDPGGKWPKGSVFLVTTI